MKDTVQIELELKSNVIDRDSAQMASSLGEGNVLFYQIQMM